MSDNTPYRNKVLINYINIVLSARPFEIRQKMNNKTANRSLFSRNRQNYTQTSFKRRGIYSPIRSQKSFQEQLKTEVDVIKHYPITCTNWCIFDSNCNQFVGVRQEQQRQVASLTKIMTTIISIELFEKYEMDKQILIRISRSSASHIGTTAELKEGKYIKLFDLLYGAMLPSGNDAAYLLAEVFGLLLFYQSVKPQCKQYSEIESIDLTCYDTTSTFINRFLKEMNKKCKQLKMGKTVFANPHGLMNMLNVSSAKDMLTLSKYCATNKLFRQIMNCEEYKAKLYDQNLEDVFCVRKWTNTNRLLGRGWQGIKTGQTNSAGGCLASLRNGVFIIVLNCSSKESRFEDTIMLHEWYINYYSIRNQ